MGVLETLMGQVKAKWGMGDGRVVVGDLREVFVWGDERVKGYMGCMRLGLPRGIVG